MMRVRGLTQWLERTFQTILRQCRGCSKIIEIADLSSASSVGARTRDNNACESIVTEYTHETTTVDLQLTLALPPGEQPSHPARE